MDEVELSILAARSDMSYLARTLSHQLRAFSGSASSVRRVLILDAGKSACGDADALVRLGEDLLRRREIDEVRSVDWSAEVVSEAMERWFGDRAMVPVVGRRPLYQYIYSFDSARAPLVLHLDSDVLFHGRMGRWLDEMISVFARDRDAIAVVPNAAVPQANRPVEWLLGRRVDRPRWPSGWAVGTGVTSRALLVHRMRLLSRLLPLQRIENEQWEASVSRTLACKGLRVHSFLGDDAWIMHPHQHNAVHARWLGPLIAEVEAGGFPYRRFGHPWDITTEGWKFWPWLPRLGLRRVRAAWGRSNGP